MTDDMPVLPGITNLRVIAPDELYETVRAMATRMHKAIYADGAEGRDGAVVLLACMFLTKTMMDIAAKQVPALASSVVEMWLVEQRVIRIIFPPDMNRPVSAG